MAWEKWDTITSTLEHVITVLAAIAAGIWAYFHYFKGRTYAARLEPKVLGRICRNTAATCLFATAQVKNVGLSKVAIEQKGTAVRILKAVVDSTGQRVKWELDRALSVFEAHGWIESGETIDDMHLIPIPDDATIAFMVDLRIVSKGMSWRARAIVETQSSGGDQVT